MAMASVNSVIGQGPDSLSVPPVSEQSVNTDADAGPACNPTNPPATSVEVANSEKLDPTFWFLAAALSAARRKVLDLFFE
jgi:hypothetical protein